MWLGLWLLALLPLLLAAKPGASQQWGSPVWNDEFNGAPGTAIDSAKWTYDTGNLGVNNEIEFYCAPGSGTAPCDPKNPNAFVAGQGHLVIQAIRVNSNIAAGSNAWTSARLTTADNLANFQYGRIEARMQLPVGPGIWPAFWALGSNIGSVNWPASGEIDFMENVPGSSGQGPAIISATIHGPGYSGAGGIGKQFTFPSGEQVNTAFHTYGAIWSPNMIQFYVDDPANVFLIRTACEVPAGSEWRFNSKMFLLLNLAVGGAGSWPGSPDSTTPSPAPMLVDYVRVYQPVPINGPAMTASAVTIQSGMVGVSTINLSSVEGTGRVYLTCSGAPVNTTCTVSSGDALNANVVDFGKSAVATASVKVTTTANTPRGPGTPAPGGGTPLGKYTLTVTAYTVSGGISSVSVPVNVN